MKMSQKIKTQESMKRETYGVSHDSRILIMHMFLWNVLLTEKV